MTKEELSRAYTHKKVEEKIVSDISEFMPSDIIQAYEDGYDKAAELAMGWLKNNAERYVYWMDEEFGNEDLLEDFKKYMEEQV